MMGSVYGPVAIVFKSVTLEILFSHIGGFLLEGNIRKTYSLVHRATAESFLSYTYSGE
jgi:hypothetical protein